MPDIENVSGELGFDFDKSIIAYDPFVLTVGRFEPGTADKFVESQEGSRREIAQGELMYYRGEIAEALRAGKNPPDSSSDAELLGYFLVFAVSSLASADFDEHLDSLKDRLFSLLESGMNVRSAQTAAFFRLYFNILIHNADDLDFPSLGMDAFAVPDELKPMAFFAYAHYLEIRGDTGRAIGLTEGALLFMEHTCPVSEIYLCLINAVCYISRKDWRRAEFYFKYAWELAVPDGLIMPFVEFHFMLCGLLEKCVRPENRELYKKISELSSVYRRNWIKLHNLFTGDRITDKLTAYEFNVAMLAARHITNAEIARFLGISVNSVRAHLRNIFNKLDIDSRKKLDRFVIS
ncbi:MAG: helix-turn-helix transcriptional regulator [Clostridia bacterium]|nr:helix-turn-helix transcriptional regulator [Clostridia bacterium]